MLSSSHSFTGIKDYINFMWRGTHALTLRFTILPELGNIYSLGSNSNGQLGIGDALIASTSSARKISSLEGRLFISISCGWSHSIAVTGHSFIRFGKMFWMGEQSTRRSMYSRNSKLLCSSWNKIAIKMQSHWCFMRIPSFSISKWCGKCIYLRQWEKRAIGE